MQMIRNGDEIRFVETWNDDFVEGTEARFARVVCASRRLFPGAEFIDVQIGLNVQPDPLGRLFFDQILQLISLFLQRAHQSPLFP